MNEQQRRKIAEITIKNAIEQIIEKCKTIEYGDKVEIKIIIQPK